MKRGSACRAEKSCAGKVRKQLCKKILAVSLSAATAASLLPLNTTAVSAAAKTYVSMRTTFKTLLVGQKNRMTLKNNTAGWKIKKISTNDESIASVSAKKEDSFQIRGKSVGRTTVKAVLKTTSRKKHNSKTVRCRVNVIAADDSATPEPEPPTQPTPVTESEVSTQEQLDQALLNTSLKKLTITSEQAAKFVIPTGSYPNVSLIVDAPAADIENSGVFQSIEIRAVKPDTWFEKAVGNVMRITAKAARVIVNQGAQVKELTFPQADADVKLEVNGKAEHIRIQSKMKLAVSGSPETDLSVSVEQTAADTQIVSETPLKLSLFAAASLIFEKGSEGSAVSLAAESTKAQISNLTSKVISAKRPNGTSVNIYAGQKNLQISSDHTQNTGSNVSGSGWDTNSNTDNNTGSGSGSGSGTGSGSQDENKNDIPIPKMEEILKGISATLEMYSDGTNRDDTKVYWDFVFQLKKNVTLFEDQPQIMLQYNTMNVDDETKWNDSSASPLRARSTIQTIKDYQLSGSRLPTTTFVVYFRYADKEKNTAGKPIKIIFQDWNEEIVRQHVAAFVTQREAEWKDKPFSLKIPVNTPQDQRITMAFDENNLKSATNLKELPQWTGAGPKVPQIQAADVIQAIDLTKAAATVIISGSSLESMKNDKKGEFHCKIEIPINLAIPAELPEGKCQWRTPNAQDTNWYDITDNKISYVLNKYLTWATACSDTPISLEMEFRYMSAGGATASSAGDGSDLYSSSQIVIQPFNSSFADSCLSLIEQNADLLGESGNVCCKLNLNKGFTADNLVIKPVGDPMTKDQLEKIDRLPADWEIQRPPAGFQP
ncbi:MAG: hypothetical protein HFH30_12145 [Eubacterium sp.]|nr:hypothetical protein [Eubacterium sp.]